MKAAQRRRRIAPIVLLIVALASLPAACNVRDRTAAISVPGGDPRTGAELIRQWGCGSCHTIPGIRAANGLVGPPLAEFGSRAYIAGNLVNNPDNLVRWIMDPQEIEPGTAMPDLRVTEDVARHMSAYLYTLRR